MTSDIEYTRQIRNTRRRLAGKSVQGKKIIKVGRPVNNKLNAPTLIPVQLSDGTYRVLWSESGPFLQSENPKVNTAIRNSQRMPLVAKGIGSDVMHIRTYPRRSGIKHAFIKCYYNEKADRYNDSITFVKD